MRVSESSNCSVLWEGDHVSVVTPRNYDYETLDSTDQVFIIPFFLKEKKFLIRKELVPSYNIRKEDSSELSYTILSESIEGTEDTLEKTLLRAMSEKAGILFDIDDDVLFLIKEGPIPLMKGLTAKVTIYLVVLGDYYKVTPKKDLSYIERQSETMLCSIDEINEILFEGNFDYLFLTGMNMIVKSLDTFTSLYLKEKGLVKDE